MSGSNVQMTSTPPPASCPSSVVLAHGREQRREARVGDDDEALVEGRARPFFIRQGAPPGCRCSFKCEFGQAVVGRDEEEGVARGAPHLAHARHVAQRALRLRQEAFDDERREVVLQHHVLEVAMQLRDGLLRATHGRELSGVLGEKRAVE